MVILWLSDGLGCFRQGKSAMIGHGWGVDGFVDGFGDGFGRSWDGVWDCQFGRDVRLGIGFEGVFSEKSE